MRHPFVVIEEIVNSRKLSERPRLPEPSGPPRGKVPHHIGAPHLKFLEEYKPMAKNPKALNNAEHIEDQLWPF